MTRTRLRWAAAAGLLTVGVTAGTGLVGEAGASFTGTASIAPTVDSATMAAPEDLTCVWTSATKFTLGWSVTPSGTETSTDVWRSDTAGGAQTLSNNVPVGVTAATVTPPTPVTTVRWMTANTKRSIGVWTSTQPAATASNSCRGSVNAFAGSGTAGFSGDGGPASAAALNAPRGIAVDPADNVYIADTANNRIRKVSGATGVITTVVGAGGASPFSACSYSGAAIAAKLNAPQDVAVDTAGNLFIADTGANCIRKVDTLGNMTPLAGGGATTTCNAAGVATSVSMSQPKGVTVDSTGAVIVADSGRNCIRKISGASFSHVAGGGATTTCNSTGLATAVSLSNPSDVAVNSSNEVLVADTARNCIRKISGSNFSPVAGGGATTTCGSSGASTAVSLLAPEGVAVDETGRVLISDTGRRCTRLVAAGSYSQLAFSGTNSSIGDNGPSIAATIATPSGVAVAGDGTIYLADRSTTATSSRVRRIVGPFPD